MNSEGKMFIDWCPLPKKVVRVPKDQQDVIVPSMPKLFNFARVDGDWDSLKASPMRLDRVEMKPVHRCFEIMGMPYEHAARYGWHEPTETLYVTDLGVREMPAGPYGMSGLGIGQLDQAAMGQMAEHFHKQGFDAGLGQLAQARRQMDAMAGALGGGMPGALGIGGGLAGSSPLQAQMGLGQQEHLRNRVEQQKGQIANHRQEIEGNRDPLTHDRLVMHDGFVNIDCPNGDCGHRRTMSDDKFERGRKCHGCGKRRDTVTGLDPEIPARTVCWHCAACPVCRKPLTAYIEGILERASFIRARGLPDLEAGAQVAPSVISVAEPVRLGWRARRRARKQAERMQKRRHEEIERLAKLARKVAKGKREAREKAIADSARTNFWVLANSKILIPLEKLRAELANAEPFMGFLGRRRARKAYRKHERRHEKLTRGKERVKKRSSQRYQRQAKKLDREIRKSQRKEARRVRWFRLMTWTPWPVRWLHNWIDAKEQARLTQKRMEESYWRYKATGEVWPKPTQFWDDGKWVTT